MNSHTGDFGDRIRDGPDGPDGEEAISNVLGAILVFGLLVITLVVVQVKFVPVWEEDREASHMQEVTVQLGQLKSDLDRQVDNRTNVAIASPLTLQRPGGMRFFTSARLPGEVGFTPSAPGTGLTIDSPRLTILQSGGQSFLGLADDDDWVPIAGSTDTLTDVTLVRALRMRIDMDVTVCGTYAANDSATLIITDDNGNEAGRAVASWLPSSSSEWALRLDIFANFDNGAVADDQISSDTEFFFQQLCQGSQENYLDYHYFDLLDPSLLFDAVLESADFPVTLTIAENGLVASYVIVYDQAAPGGGTTTVGSLGLVVAPYNPDPFAAGSLVFESKNQRFVDQSYVLEHGALLRVQGLAAALAVPPNFQVAQSVAQTTLDWTLPSLQGGSGSLVGADTASVIATPLGNRIQLQATAASLTIVIPTAYPAVWEAYLDRELRDAGLEETNGDYTLAAGASSVSLAIVGVSTDANVNDLFLNLHQATIDLELRSSG